MYRWAENTTIKFVEEYLKHDCLWDSRHVSYKNAKTKEARKAAYSAIRSAMNIDGFGHNEIVQKIKNIRSTYSQELKKIKESKAYGVDEDYVYVPNIKWFYMLKEKLQSIEPGTKPRPPRLSSPDISNICTYEPQDTFVYDQSQTNNEDTNNCNDYSKPSSSQIQPKRKMLENQDVHGSWTNLDTKNRNDYTMGSSYQISPKKRKFENLSSVVKEIKELKEGTSNRHENEFELFGRLVATQLKALPLPLAIEAQQHVQTYINEFRLSHYKEIQGQASVSRLTVDLLNKESIEGI